MKSIFVLQGPNLNLVGQREPSVYGRESLTDWLSAQLPRWAREGAEVHIIQSNHEGELIDALHAQGFKADGIVFNPGGFTHTSVALRDAVAAIEAPVIEVHLTNIHAREPFRQHSMISGVCVAVISGLGFAGYEAAVQYVLHH